MIIDPNNPVAVAPVVEPTTPASVTPTIDPANPAPVETVTTVVTPAVVPVVEEIAVTPAEEIVPVAKEQTVLEKIEALSAKNGEYTPEDIVSMAESGLTPEMLTTYNTGKAKQSNAVVEDLQAKSGGAEAFNSMVAWAEKNLSKEELTAYESQLESTDINARNFALKALQTQYSEAPKGFSRTVIADGNPPPSIVSDTYNTTGEYLSAKKDPRYKSTIDPSYKKMVDDKWYKTNFK